MTDPTSQADNPEMGHDFAAVYEATAHRITGPVSNTALDIVGVGPGTRILDIAAGAGALSGPAAERGAAVLATDIAPGMVRRLAERLRPFHRDARLARWTERLSPFRTQASMLHFRSLA